MNVHKNARLTPKGRELLIGRLERGEHPEDVAGAMGVSTRTKALLSDGMALKSKLSRLFTVGKGIHPAAERHDDQHSKGDSGICYSAKHSTDPPISRHEFLRLPSIGSVGDRPLISSRQGTQCREPFGHHLPGALINGPRTVAAGLEWCDLLVKRTSACGYEPKLGPRRRYDRSTPES